MPLDKEFRNVSSHSTFNQKFASNIDVDDYHDPPKWEAYVPSMHNTVLIGFKIWYGDGSVWTSADGRWQDAPTGEATENPDRLGVQVVMLYENYISRNGTNRRFVIAGNNYYYRADRQGESVYGAMTEESAIDLPQFVALTSQGHYKYGRWVDNTTFRTIYNNAMNDYDISVFTYL